MYNLIKIFILNSLNVQDFMELENNSAYEKFINAAHEKGDEKA